MQSQASPGDETLVVLRNAGGDQATVSLHGAQLLSWHPAGEDEQIYCSPLSRPAAGKALRGGVPVCFPQFSERGPLPKHGFARTSRWELVAPPAPQARIAEARFQLDSGRVTPQWEHAFRLVLVVRLGPKWLELHLEAANTGSTAYTFTAALHTYLKVHDVRLARVLGLQGLTYEDLVQGKAVRTEGEAERTVSDEVDRVYRGVDRPLQLVGGAMPDRLLLQQGFTDAVVWNPGPAKAALLGDMPANDWVRMLCIEAAVVQDPVELAPGEGWRGMQRIELPRAAGFDPARYDA
jgi:glucose-6-phosphate 1-epimerase